VGIYVPKKASTSANFCDATYSRTNNCGDANEISWSFDGDRISELSDWIKGNSSDRS